MFRVKVSCDLMLCLLQVSGEIVKKKKKKKKQKEDDASE